MKYTISELANSKGVSPLVREALLHMEAVIVKANSQAEHCEREWYLRGDELEATNRQVEILSDALAESRREVAALKAVQEPVAWMHVMDNTEGIKANGKGIVSITQKRKHPFGKPGVDFSKSFPVTSTPLYTTPPAALKAAQDNDAHYKGVVEGVQKLFDDKRAQPASVQEPVAWCSQCGHKCPQAVNQEPVGWWDAKLGFFEEKHFDQLRPLYTTPPAAQRQWVGLTDKERNKLWRDVVKWGDPSHDDVDLIKAIEAKLKEKNT